MGDGALPRWSGEKWVVEWYRKDDIAIIWFEDSLSEEILKGALDGLQNLLDTAQGDLLIYIIAEESKITHISPTIGVQAALHPAYFHPRGGKVYIVGSQGELRKINEVLGDMRQGQVRLVETLDEAVTDIDARRAAYFARKQSQKGSDP